MADALSTPDKDIALVKADEGEILQIGATRMRILEDGSRTGTRLGVVEIILPPNTNGPTPHWHEMHDETFLMTQGRARFTVRAREGDGLEAIDVGPGDFITAQIRAVHTFSNPFAQEAKMICTVTPHFYIGYFRTIAALFRKGELNNKTVNAAMERYATIQLPGESEWQSLVTVKPAPSAP